MHEEYIGRNCSACIAMTVIIVALFLFRLSQECSVSVASLLLRLPF